jgi:hypothetical protein
MGLEATAIAHWQGQSGPVRLHLDSTAFDLKGAIRLSIPRAAIADPRAEAGRLTLTAHGEPLAIDLPEADAARWCAALLKPVPTLAQKLGIGPEAPACLVGETDDTTLLTALEAARAATPDDARILIAIVHAVADLEPAATLAGPRPVWIVTGKGRHATVRESDLRTWLRDAGFGDSKSCAVSETLTATRWQRRRER